MPADIGRMRGMPMKIEQGEQPCSSRVCHRPKLERRKKSNLCVNFGHNNEQPNHRSNQVTRPGNWKFGRGTGNSAGELETRQGNWILETRQGNWKLGRGTGNWKFGRGTGYSAGELETRQGNRKLGKETGYWKLGRGIGNSASELETQQGN